MAVRPPSTLAREQVLAGVLVDAARDQLLDSAHDLSEGGLAQALAEAALRGGCGVRITLPDGADPFVALFSESTARAVVSVARGDVEAFEALCAERGQAVTRLGVLDVLDAALTVEGQFRIGLRELREVWTRTLPARFA